MRIPSGTTDQYIYFVAVDSTDFTTRETGLTTWTVYRSRNGGTAAVYTTPTINETDVTNMPGVYELLLDEDMTIGSGNDTEEVVLHITHAGMAPVTRTFELYRPKITVGETLTASAGSVNADAVAISGDSTAADNLELQYDGSTGLSGDTFPATQASVANIGSVGPGSTNFIAVEDNSSSPIKGVSSVGTVSSGSFANTEVEDGVFMDIADVGNDIDWIFGFDIGGGNQATQTDILANVNGNADEMVVKAYDFEGADWDTIGTLSGSGGSSFTRLNLTLLDRHTGSGADVGKVYIRFDTDSTTPSQLQVDKILIGAVTTSKTVGYEAGSVWVNTSTGVAGTESFVNGVADNPCASYANALTIASNVGLSRYTFATGDSISLTQSHALDAFFGYNYALDINGQVAPTYIEGAEVTGATANTFSHYVRDCRVGTTSTSLAVNSGCVFVTSGIVNLQLKDSAGAALDVEFLDCHGNTQGWMFPGASIDFGTTAGTNHEVSFQRWGGPCTITNLKDGDTVYAHGNGTFILDASCTGGSFRVAGMINLQDNSGNVSILEDARLTKTKISETILDTALSAHTTSGTLGDTVNNIQSKLIRRK